MDPNTIKQLLLNTARESGPRVKLQNVGTVEIKEESSNSLAFENSICTLCGFCGPVTYVALQCDILNNISESSTSQPYKAAPYCRSCMIVVSRIKELLKQEVRLREELEDKRTAVCTMLRVGQHGLPEKDSKGITAKI